MLDTVELPGAIGVADVCPDCSKRYAEKDFDKDEPLDVPDTCRRCHCPMDKEKALRFSDDQAKLHQTVWQRRVPVAVE